MPLTAKILKTIEIVGHDAFLRWCRTPNREAYVARALHQTARDAVEAVAADLAAPVAVTRTPARDNPLTPPVVEMAAIALFRDLDLAERATPDVVALAWEGLTDPEREKWRSVVRKTFAAPARLVADDAFRRALEQQDAELRAARVQAYGEGRDDEAGALPLRYHETP